MPEPDRLQQILDFLWTIDRMKTIYRSSPLHDHSRRENDAEHSWHMAMYCLLLGRELQVDCDLGRVLEMVLCHDLVEIPHAPLGVPHAEVGVEPGVALGRAHPRPQGGPQAQTHHSGG